MSGVLFASPLPVAAIAVTRGAGAARLLTADPREAFVDSLVGTPVRITIDLGAVTVIDTIYLGFTNALDATWSAMGGVAAADEQRLFIDTPLAVPGVLPGRPVHGLALLDAPVALRRVAVTVRQPVGSAGLVAGILAVAQAFRPTWGHEWGGGRGLLDLAPKTRHAGGGIGVGEGTRKATWQATLGDLTDTDLDQLWALARKHGETRPLLVVEEPSRTIGLAERMHWATFDRLEPYERQARGRTRWAVRCEDWL